MDAAWSATLSSGTTTRPCIGEGETVLQDAQPQGQTQAEDRFRRKKDACSIDFPREEDINYIMETVTIKNEYARLPFAIVLKYSTALSWDSSMAEKAKPPWIRPMSDFDDIILICQK